MRYEAVDHAVQPVAMIPDMEKSYAAADEKLVSYVTATFPAEDEVLREVRERSKLMGLPSIQVGSHDGLHLEVLTRALGARRVVEIGTLGGYSGIHIARAIPADGRLHTFEYEPKYAEVAAESFRKAGVAAKVTIHVGAALEKLKEVEAEGPFDLVFIDADKVSYPGYLAWAAKNLRVGGAVLADNTFAWGMIADERIDDAEDRAAVEALRRFNTEAASGGRFQATMLPTGEGLTLAVKIR